MKLFVSSSKLVFRGFLNFLVMLDFLNEGRVFRKYVRYLFWKYFGYLLVIVFFNLVWF